MFRVENMDYLSHKAVYIGPPSEDYVNGKEYSVLVQKLSDGRYSVFKSSEHYNESPGYKLFKDSESIKTQFKYDTTD